MDTRRDFIKKASLLAGGAGIWNSLPASIKRAIAINPDPGTTFENAEHVVLLMQENRSFDHCYGSLQGVRGFNDPRFITLPSADPVWLQSTKEGKKYAPFRLNIKDTKATWIGGLPHSWDNQVDARNNGKYDKWLEAKQPGNKDYKEMPLTMGYYNREDIPFYYSLADAFTICDQHFCSSLTGTTPNRSFFWTGKTLDESEPYARVRNSDLYYNREAKWKTFPERLEENDISWKVYQNEISVQTELDGEADSLLSNFTDNNLEWFSKYNVRFHKAHYDFLLKRSQQLPAEITALQQEVKKARKNHAKKIEKKLQQKTEQLAKYKEELVTWNPGNFEKLSAFEKSIHQKAFTTNVNDPHYHTIEPFSYLENGGQRTINMPKGDVLHQFRSDVNSGKLPTVSWLVAPQYFSDHPSAPWFGAWYVSEVMDILTKNPEVWKKTIFILNYDENDGYFDHVPPFVAPDPNNAGSGKVSDGINTRNEYVTLKEELTRKDADKEDLRESPVGLGYRVPLVIASPWTRGGWVNSQVCDITSTLQFLEKFLSKKTGKEIKETNISDWRRLVSGDLTSAFRPYNSEKVVFPNFVKHDEFVEEIYNAKFKKLPSGYKALTEAEVAQVNKSPHNSSLLPQQEKGIRDSCALPYQLYVDGHLSADKKTFDVRFAAGKEVFGNQSAGAPFSVYAPGMHASNDDKEKSRSFEKVKAWNYAVKAGDEINYQWPVDNFQDGKYHLRAYGPNGFYREFAGTQSDPQLNITADYERLSNNTAKLSGNIIFSIENLSNNETYVVELADVTYGKSTKTMMLEKGKSVTVAFHLADSYGWYDIVIKVKDHNHFKRNYAGRVETGSHTKSDPFMGRAI